MEMGGHVLGLGKGSFDGAADGHHSATAAAGGVRALGATRSREAPRALTSELPRTTCAEVTTLLSVSHTRPLPWPMGMRSRSMLPKVCTWRTCATARVVLVLLGFGWVRRHALCI